MLRRPRTLRFKYRALVYGCLMSFGVFFGGTILVNMVAAATSADPGQPASRSPVGSLCGVPIHPGPGGAGCRRLLGGPPVTTRRANERSRRRRGDHDLGPIQPGALQQRA